MRFFDFLKGPDINQGVKEYSTTDSAVLLDVRTPDEYRQGHIPGSKNVPLQSIDKVGCMIDNKATPIFVHCLSGARSRQAAAILKQMGYTNVKNIAEFPLMQERWNDNMKVVIVGGVAGGATAAARIRRLNEQAEIVVFERSGYISYANCGLPYYIGDVITDRSDLTLQTPESFFSRFHVNMKVRHEVTAIHPEKKKLP